MTAPRRARAEESETRTRLLDATEGLMLREGYAAVTARRIAAEAGVTAPLVHYHFGPLDDLFIALLRRRTEDGLARQTTAMAGPRPLTALWDFSFATASVRYTTEFMALAHHRDAVRSELLLSIRAFNEAAAASLREADRDGRINLAGADPAGIVVALINSARGIAMQRVLGFTEGHDQALRIVAGLIEPFETADGRPAAKRLRRLKR
jgi:AcrR family transcriptional regulator